MENNFIPVVPIVKMASYLQAFKKAKLEKF
jgi:hypothetical protein